MICFFLSEGQRKANFEEYGAKKRANAQKIVGLKKKVKELYTKYAKAKNVKCTANKVGRFSLIKNHEMTNVYFFQNEEAMERAALLSRDSVSCAGKRNLEEIIATASENNVRLRKKLDLIKYQREKVRSWM